MASHPLRRVFEDAVKKTQATPGAPQLDSSHFFSDSMASARFTLANGMRVVLMVDTRAPVFTYQTWFAVGSADEDPQQTGIAHLFEHLMFKATRTHALGVFDREMESRGAQTNAATWVDWTYYTQSLAMRGDNLETVIGFESDRMTGLVLNEETFRSELEVVKNERRMSVEDSVQGSMGESLAGLAFESHPYRWPTIGSMAHLENMQVADLQQFYRAHYAPNNATVVVAGDLDVCETLALISSAYGGMSPQPVEQRTRAAEPQQREARIQRLPLQVRAPQLAVAYHIPGQMDPAHQGVEILANAICGGESSRLYRSLVIEQQLALDVEAFVTPFRDPGLLEFAITARDGVDEMRLLDIFQKELDDIGRMGLSDQEWSKACNDLEASHWLELGDSESCAENLGHYETNYTDYQMAFAGVERLHAMSQRHVQKIAESVVRESNRSAIIAVPRDKQP